MTYRETEGLDYPINYARTIARETVGTLYYLSADIELYPSVNLIPMFLDFVKREGYLADPSKRKTAFVLPWFEMETGYAMPKTKMDLALLYFKKKAFTFAHNYCPQCHEIPKLNRWMRHLPTRGNKLFKLRHPLSRAIQSIKWGFLQVGWAFSIQ